MPLRFNVSFFTPPAPRARRPAHHRRACASSSPRSSNSRCRTTMHDGRNAGSWCHSSSIKARILRGHLPARRAAKSAYEASDARGRTHVRGSGGR